MNLENIHSCLLACRRSVVKYDPNCDQHKRFSIKVSFLSDIFFITLSKKRFFWGIIIQIVRLIYLKVSLVLSKQINFFIQPRSDVIKDCGNSLCDVIYDRFKANLGKLICRFVEKIFEENRSINPSFIRSFVQRLICESSFHNKIEPFGTNHYDRIKTKAFLQTRSKVSQFIRNTRKFFKIDIKVQNSGRCLLGSFRADVKVITNTK